jgi:hypothetical protein
MPQNDILYKTFWQNDNEDIFKVYDDGKYPHYRFAKKFYTKYHSEA